MLCTKKCCRQGVLPLGGWKSAFSLTRENGFLIMTIIHNDCCRTGGSLTAFREAFAALAAYDNLSPVPLWFWEKEGDVWRRR